MKQPHCWVISHPGSSAIVECRRSLEQHQWNFDIFPAVDGRLLTPHDWLHIGVSMQGGKMASRPGAQGCWMSHWQLWNRAVDQQTPLVILEHDVLINAPWPTDLDIEPNLVKLYRHAETKFKPLFGNWSKGSHAYTVTPSQAQRLIDFARDHIAQAVDKHLGDRVLPWRFYHEDLVSLNPRRGPSVTSPVTDNPFDIARFRQLWGDRGS